MLGDILTLVRRGLHGAATAPLIFAVNLVDINWLCKRTRSKVLEGQLDIIWLLISIYAMLCVALSFMSWPMI